MTAEPTLNKKMMLIFKTKSPNDVKIIFMPKGTFDMQQFFSQIEQPQFNILHQVWTDDRSKFREIQAEFWAPTDFDILFFYQIGIASGSFEVSIRVEEFASEDEIRTSQFGPYSKVSLNGFGNVTTVDLKVDEDYVQVD